MNSKIKLEKVEFVPKALEPATLYVSERYKVAVHLCACGCENKVTTPLGPAEWAFHSENGKPTLYPSIGNWQIPCKSHYWIKNGEIIWSYAWTDEQIERGRTNDQQRLEEYFKKSKQKVKKSPLARMKEWLISLFK